MRVSGGDDQKLGFEQAPPFRPNYIYFRLNRYVRGDVPKVVDRRACFGKTIVLQNIADEFAEILATDENAAVGSKRIRVLSNDVSFIAPPSQCCPIGWIQQMPFN